MGAIDPLMSAEVVLEPQAAQADTDSYEKLKDFFRSKGFTVGPESPLSFSISAPRSAFHRLFGDVGTGEQQLSLKGVRVKLRNLVRGVYFTKPPDFGPTSY